jgi:phosphate transport system substrate-binding protein
VKTTRTARAALLATAVALVLTACGSSDSGTDSSESPAGDLTGAVRIDGSSTVAPLTSAASELFREVQPGVNVTVGTSGTGGGFEKFCRGETDINDASRPIKDTELATCTEAGIETASLTVAVDALTVVVNKENTWATCLTVEQLNKMWAPDSTVDNWNQIDPSFPDEKLTLFGPGTDSGTFDYFTDVINGEEGASRTDFTPSEDDNVIVKGVEGTKGGLGYFGFTYFEENAENLNAVQIDGGEGCVTPSVETAQDGSYQPLSRPLFIYPSVKAIAENPAAKAFLEFYVAEDAQIAEAALFIPLNPEQQATLESDLQALFTKAGV